MHDDKMFTLKFLIALKDNWLFIKIDEKEKVKIFHYKIFTAHGLVKAYPGNVGLVVGHCNKVSTTIKWVMPE